MKSSNDAVFVQGGRTCSIRCHVLRFYSITKLSTHVQYRIHDVMAYCTYNNYIRIHNLEAQPAGCMYVTMIGYM